MKFLHWDFRLDVNIDLTTNSRKIKAYLLKYECVDLVKVTNYLDRYFFKTLEIKFSPFSTLSEIYDMYVNTLKGIFIEPNDDMFLGMCLSLKFKTNKDYKDAIKYFY